MENKQENVPQKTPQPSVKPNSGVKPPVNRPVNRPGVKPAPKPPKPKSESNVDGFKVFSIILNVLLLAGIGYLLFDKFYQQTNQVAEAQQSADLYKNDVEKKVAEITRLQDSIKTVISEKQALGLALEEEKAKLVELEDLKSQIRNHQVSINSLNRKLSKYKKEYEIVTASIESLTAENKQLITEKETLQQQIKAKDDSLQTTLQKIKTVATTVAAEKPVASGGHLKAENINVKVVNTLGKELPEAQNYKAMVVLRVKMFLELADASSLTGRKDIYLRFIDPSGTAAFEGENLFIAEGKKTFYTDKQTIDFSKPQKSITFMYSKPTGRFKPGKYMIEFYADGKKIGDSHLTLVK